MSDLKKIQLNLSSAQAEVIAEFLGVVGDAETELWKEQRHGLTHEECDNTKAYVINQLKEQAYA